MEEDTQATPVTTVVEDTKNIKIGDETEITRNGDLLKKGTQGSNEQDEETSLEGEFIKVEKESFDLRDASPAAYELSETVHEHKRPSFFPRSKLISDESREMLVELSNSTQQRSLELEDLMQVSHSKVGDAIKRVGELEILLEAERYRIKELEDQIGTLDTKCVEKEAESKKLMGEISGLSEELDIFQTKSRSLEVALQTTNEKDRELTECLNVIKEERKTF